jgi:hypothetical protein
MRGKRRVCPPAGYLSGATSLIGAYRRPIASLDPLPSLWLRECGESAGRWQKKSLNLEDWTRMRCAHGVPGPALSHGPSWRIPDARRVLHGTERIRRTIHTYRLHWSRVRRQHKGHVQRVHLCNRHVYVVSVLVLNLGSGTVVLREFL